MYFTVLKAFPLLHCNDVPAQGVPIEEVEDLKAIYGRSNPLEQLRSVFPMPTKKLFETAFTAADYRRLIVVRHPWTRWV